MTKSVNSNNAKMKSLRLIAMSAGLLLALGASAQPAASGSAPAAPTADAWVTLGTGGGPLIRLQRSEPANALVVNGAVYLFDTGSGTERQLTAAGLKLSNVKAVFISHHHIDHDADLGQLMSSRWMFNSYAPLPVIGPPGTVQMVADLSSAARSVEWAGIGDFAGKRRPGVGASIKPADLPSTLDEPAEVYKDANIRVLAVTNTHYHYPQGSEEARMARSYSYRIETPSRSIVYTGDTGPSANVEKLAKGADLLVSEVIDLDKMDKVLSHAPDLPAAMRPSMLRHMEEDHLTPQAVGRLAAAAGVKAVVLTHLAPGMDNEPDPDSYARGLAPAYTGPVTVARDLQRF